MKTHVILAKQRCMNHCKITQIQFLKNIISYVFELNNLFQALYTLKDSFIVFSFCSEPLEVSYDSCRSVHPCIARRIWSFWMDIPLISPHLISTLHLKAAGVSVKTEPNSVFHKIMSHPDSVYHSLLKNLSWTSIVMFPHCPSKTNQSDTKN